ncbi:IclR family transcriptional regulator [Sinomonas terrae]|uniref:IclR family transcriptional regulator n=1 Tax=Sinomonas terrae TaxID=2908838 RepID=A0ABS9U0F5_9MICC|nr:IclR family transcriptional regulator [Sinomonas terrae]MCH6470161.1 IclR family transcriptional regulator [Sinomonas terrae]
MRESDRSIESSPAAAVTRGIELLEFLARSHGPLSLADLAKGIGAARSSTRNVCIALEAGGLIQRTDGGYLLGWRLVELGGAHLSSFDQIREFYRACSESPLLGHELVQVAVLEGSTDVLYVARHEGRAPLQLSAGFGDRFPAALTAVGQALLALLGDRELGHRFSDTRVFEAGTQWRVRNLEQLVVRLGEVRARGYAVDHGGVHPAVTGIAAAVPGPGVPRFAVGVSLIGIRADGEDLAQYGKAVRTMAAQMALPTGRMSRAPRLQRPT